MKCLINRIKTSGFLFRGAMLLALAIFVMAACDNGTSSSSDTPPSNGGGGGTTTPTAQTATYTGTKGGTTWKLVITEVLATARYTAKIGDKYELTQTTGGVTKTSRGTVGKVTASSTSTTYTLTPANQGATTFDVSIGGGTTSGSASGTTISSITGSICYTDGQYGQAPGIVSGSSGGGGGGSSGGGSGGSQDPVPTTVAAPVANPPGGRAVADPTTIGLTTTTTDAKIYFTLDGTEPSASSTEYVDPTTMPVITAGSLTLKAIAIKDGTSSAVTTATYTILAPDVVAAPTANPVDGTAVADPTSIKLSTTTADAKIYFTQDGNDPTASSTEYVEGTTQPVITAGNLSFKAIAIKDGMTDSVVLEATYTIMAQVAEPTADPPAGNVAENAEITLSAETGATIYYTLNGSTPTKTVSATNFQYSDTTKPILETDTTTLKAIAVKSGMTDSTVLEATYTFDLDETYNVAANYPDYAPAGLSMTVSESTDTITIKLESSSNITSGFDTAGTSDINAVVKNLFVGAGDPATIFASGAKYSWILLTGIIRKGEIGRGLVEENPSLNMYNSVASDITNHDPGVPSGTANGNETDNSCVYKKSGSATNMTPYPEDRLFGSLIWEGATNKKTVFTQKYIPVGGAASDETTRTIIIDWSTVIFN